MAQQTNLKTTQSRLMQRLVAIAVSGFLALGALSNAAQACSCVRASESTLARTYNSAEIVAQIRILEASSSALKIPYITYAAVPVTVHKGQLGDRFSLRENNNSCANFFQKGQVVDVAINRETGRLSLANQCTQLQIQEYLRIEATRSAPARTPMDDASAIDTDGDPSIDGEAGLE